MTDNRETIAMLKMLKEQALKSHNDTAVLEVKIDSFNFVLDEAIKALEQEPCEDAISRKAVLDKLNKLIEVERLQGTDEMGYGRERVSAYECMIHSIESEYLYPSVNPQQPCEDCRNCKKWDKCPCGKEGHENGTSIGYSIGECKNYEPCEDCISRQEAINCVTLNEFRYKIVEDMKTLPSVTPKERTGHWKPIEYDGYADGYPVWDVWECSKCGCEHNGDKESLTAFCPDCGAKMIEPQESEEKE